MKRQTQLQVCVLFLVGLTVGCASVSENLISPPNVELTDVEVMDLGFNHQTFLLSFEVDNTNAFSLPVSYVDYGVTLDDQLFASGETVSEFTVPARGNAKFAIRVELDLLRTSPKLLSIVRAGVRQNIPYTLRGSLRINIPLTPPVRYSHSGMLKFSANTTEASLLR